MLTLKIYTDGGSRGNPGQSAIAGLIFSDGERLASFAECIGIATNNEAEYRALIKALVLAKDFMPANIICYSDSELTIRQMRLEYKVKHPNLRHLFNKATTCESFFGTAHYVHLPRESKYIVECDAMLNEALDS